MLVSVLLLMFLLPVLFPGKITREVKAFANRKLNGELNFKEAKLSFFHHFPSLTLTLTHFELKGSPPFKNESLLSSDEISFGINLKSLVFGGEVNIDKIFLANAFANIKVNENGEANYNVYVSDSKATSADTANTKLRLEKIVIENSHIVYDDQSTKMLIDAKGFGYTGNGDLNEAVFDLHTDASINDFNFAYGGEVYLKNKKVNAQLITQINTHSLAFVFRQNNIKINKLPVDFNGKLDFLSNGYNMDFTVKSTNSLLNDFFTALPPAYVTWLDKAKVQGSTDLLFTLKGKYITSENKMPDVAFNMKIRNGYINYNQAPLSASNLYLNFETKVPGLDPEKLNVTVDSLFFNLDKDYVKAIVKSVGLSKPDINAQVKADVDLGKMWRTFGLKTMDLRGILTADIDAKGVYDKAQDRLPVINGNMQWKDGYLKTGYYPNPVEHINLALTVQDKTGKKKDIQVKIDPASFVFEGKPLYVKAFLENFDNISYDINAKGELDLAKIYKVFSQQGLELQGYIKADMSLAGTQRDAMKGNYKKLRNKGYLALRNIKTTSSYLPKPFIIREGLFTFNQDKMNFKNFKAVYGQSDFSMNGYMQNVIDYALTDKGVLKGKFSFDSRYVNVDEFMSAPADGRTTGTSKAGPVKATAATGVVVIPANLDLQLVAAIAKVAFEDLKLTQLKGDLILHQGQMQLKQSGFNLIGCTVLMDLLYGSKSAHKAFFDFSVRADDFDVKRAYREVKMFREMASAAASAEGIISLDYKVAGDLNAGMQPIYPSLVGGGTIAVKDVKMKGYKLFNVVGKKTGKDAINNPNLTEVNIKSTIKNNIIDIERFKFKVAGFRPRIEGQTSFDGNLALKMRLGLPPFGIIGIPLRITGTQTNPKVKIGKKMEELKETEYDNDVPLPSPLPETK